MDLEEWMGLLALSHIIVNFRTPMGTRSERICMPTNLPRQMAISRMFDLISSC